MTNADRVRNMSNELLAFTVMCPNEIFDDQVECKKAEGMNCKKCTYEWLNQEESDGE